MLDQLAADWDRVLRDIPDPDLTDLFRAGLNEHVHSARASFPMPAYLVLKQWEANQAPPPVTHGFRAWRAALGLLPTEMTTPGPVLTDEWRRRFPVKETQAPEEPSDDLS